MGAMLRGSKVRDTGVGDPAMEVMLGVQRWDLVGPRRRPGRAQGWAFHCGS